MAAAATVSTSSSTAPEAPNRILFTSFGPFLTVTDNPSRKVAAEVERLLKEEVPVAGAPVASSSPSLALSRPIAIQHDPSLEVSSAGVCDYFTALRARELALLTDNTNGDPPTPTPTTFFIHFGVYRGADSIHVELTGQNVADFSKGGDVKGLRVMGAPIVFSTSSIRGLTSAKTAVDGEKEGERKEEMTESAPPPPPQFYSPEVSEAWFSACREAHGGSTTSPPPPIPPAAASDGTSQPSPPPPPTAQLSFPAVNHSQIPVVWAQKTVEECNKTKASLSHSNGNNNANDSTTAEAKLEVSHDAGRYICNFALFSSVCLSTELNRLTTTTPTTTAPPHRYISLFIHVVDDEYISAPAQAKAVLPLLVSLFNDFGSSSSQESQPPAPNQQALAA